MPSIQNMLEKRQYGYPYGYGNGSGMSYGARIGIVSRAWYIATMMIAMDAVMGGRCTSRVRLPLMISSLREPMIPRGPRGDGRAAGQDCHCVWEARTLSFEILDIAY